MRLLIDECIDERLRLLFPGHDCQTVRFANLAGLKNGKLLDAAEAADSDVLITVDQNIWGSTQCKSRIKQNGLRSIGGVRLIRTNLPLSIIPSESRDWS